MVTDKTFNPHRNICNINAEKCCQGINRNCMPVYWLDTHLKLGYTWKHLQRGLFMSFHCMPVYQLDTHLQLGTQLMLGNISNEDFKEISQYASILARYTHPAGLRLETHLQRGLFMRFSLNASVMAGYTPPAGLCVDTHLKRGLL